MNRDNGRPSSVRSDGYYRRFTGDYLRDTLELTMEEDGAYNRLLDSYYSKEQLSSDRDTLYRIARAMTDSERKAVDKVIRLYFHQDGDLLFQERVERELAARRAYLKEQSRKGKLSAAAAREREKEPEGEPEVNHGSTGVITGDTTTVQPGMEPGLQPEGQPKVNQASRSGSGSRSGSASPAAPLEKTQGARRGKKPPGAFVLPDHIPREAWDHFEAMRNRIRKPLTVRARELIVRELEKIGGDPVAVLDQSVRNDWQDVYPLRDKGAGGTRASPPAEPKGFAAIRALRVSEGRDPVTGEPMEREVEAK